MRKSQEAPEKERVEVGCCVTLRFECGENSTKNENYKISGQQDEHAARDGILWEKSCWGEKLVGLSVGDSVSLPAPEDNVAIGTIIAIDRP